MNDLLAYTEMSALYHKAREGFLDTCHRWTMVLILISSSGVVLALTENNSLFQKSLALVPALLGALDMAFGFNQNARHHALLAREFLQLAGDVALAKQSEAELHARYYLLCAEEPATYEALQALCHNQICENRKDLDAKVDIRFYHRRLRHLLRFSGSDLRPRRTA